MEKNYFCGYEVGVLVMKSWVPKPPGHLSCATNYDFPIFYYPIENTNHKTIHGGAKEIVPALVSAAKELKSMGCHALVASCGYFGHYQRLLADADIMPTYLSALCFIPTIFKLIGKEKGLLLICYNKQKLTEELLTTCGISEEQRRRIYVYDIINEPENGRIILDCGEYDIHKGREEVCQIAKEAQLEHPDAGAILLECTDLPPHAYAIQAATNLPVFDATSMVQFVHTLVDEEVENEDLTCHSSRKGNKVLKISRGGTGVNTCLKCLYSNDDIKKSLLYRLLRQSVGVDKMILVGGYRYDDLLERITNDFAAFRSKIIMVENKEYDQYGSGYSLYKGLETAIKEEFDEIIFAEGDLYVDEDTYTAIINEQKDVITINSDPIWSNKAVVLYLDHENHVNYVYNVQHGVLQIEKPFIGIFNSGQIWKFVNPKRIRDTFLSLSPKEWQGTNLVFIQKYFEKLMPKDYEIYHFQKWINCNTIDDFNQIEGNE